MSLVSLPTHIMHEVHSRRKKITCIPPVHKELSKDPYICGFVAASCGLWHVITEANSRHRYHLSRSTFSGGSLRHASGHIRPAMESCNPVVIFVYCLYIYTSSARTSRGRKFPKGKELYSKERICL